MKLNSFEYIYKVTLLVKKDENRRFCDYYHLLNMQTCMDACLMFLIDDVLSQLDLLNDFLHWIYKTSFGKSR